MAFSILLLLLLMDYSGLADLNQIDAGRQRGPREVLKIGGFLGNILV